MGRHATHATHALPYTFHSLSSCRGCWPHLVTTSVEGQLRSVAEQGVARRAEYPRRHLQPVGRLRGFLPRLPSPSPPTRLRKSSIEEREREEPTCSSIRKGVKCRQRMPAEDSQPSRSSTSAPSASRSQPRLRSVGWASFSRWSMRAASGSSSMASRTARAERGTRHM